MEQIKSIVILSLFFVVVVALFGVVFFNGQKKIERYADDDEEASDKANVKKPSSENTEKELQKNLEKNLMIINAYEEYHGKKVSPEALSEISKIVKGDQDEKTIKEKVKNYKKEPFANGADDGKDKEILSTLKDMKDKLGAVISRLENSVDLGESKDDVKETFVVSPFSTNIKYMNV
jgi:flagellar basal body-associated protein FliL